MAQRRRCFLLKTNLCNAAQSINSLKHQKAGLVTIYTDAIIDY